MPETVVGASRQHTNRHSRGTCPKTSSDLRYPHTTRGLRLPHNPKAPQSSADSLLFQFFAQPTTRDNTNMAVPVRCAQHSLQFTVSSLPSNTAKITATNALRQYGSRRVVRACVTVAIDDDPHLGLIIHPVAATAQRHNGTTATTVRQRLSPVATLRPLLLLLPLRHHHCHRYCHGHRCRYCHHHRRPACSAPPPLHRHQCLYLFRRHHRHGHHHHPRRCSRAPCRLHCHCRCAPHQ